MINETKTVIKNIWVLEKLGVKYLNILGADQMINISWNKYAEYETCAIG